MSISRFFFVSDFPVALSSYLHQHTHMFGDDGSRALSISLAEGLEAIIREKAAMENFEEE